MKLIDADDLITKINTIQNENDSATSSSMLDNYFIAGYATAVQHILKIIKETSTVKPKNANWIDESCNEYSCSQCNGIVVMNGAKDFPYCPYCGAKMEDE